MKSKKKNSLITKGILYIILILVVLLFIFPLIWIVSTSFKSTAEIFNGLYNWLPIQPTLENYAEAVQAYPLGVWMKNSVIVVALVIVLSCVFYILPAYALARIEFKYSGVLVMLMVATIMIPKELSSIMSYKIVAKLGLLDTYSAVVIPQICDAIGVFLLYQFFRGIPKEYSEVCQLDGGGHFTILTKICLPLSGPAISVMVILTFVSSWNNFFWPLLVTFTDKSMTLPVGLATIMTSYSESSASRQYGLLMAISILTSIPALAIFIGMQKKFVEAITSTGIKG
ncbi:carbohydrate ABC transporter permease [Muricomes sp. OA1]|nr:MULTISPECIES: carbohydrate ABC transporter permease [Clostridia]MCH1974555.1 carbohydrate ABC transporter permease [Muricomes sp. OA1]MEE0200313.1 carbohydrate ABC transporter permease [Muricomes sp.]GKH33336.1 sugar ABC transporter permease [Faecalicatena contorta]